MRCTTALLVLTLAGFLVACDGGGSASGAEAPKVVIPAAYTKSFSVKGMHCEGCEGAIVDKVTKVEGVTACKASHTAEEVEVVAPAEQRDAIAAAIRKLGYKLEE
jgi:copper chaperone CopZ